MDSTSPTHVTRSDEPTFNHISLCAGYGGIDLGLKRAIGNLRTVAFSEIEAFACANLVAKMEAGLLDAAPIWTDLKTFPWGKFRGLVDILSGGFPCQPFSSAGKRKGDEDPRHLFPYILRGVTECRPSVVFLENVEGIVSSKLANDTHTHGDIAGTPVLLHVLRELERVGYRATAGVFSSAEIGASHQRKRVFILAVADSVYNGHTAAEGPSGAGPSENQGWMRQLAGVGSPQRNVYLRPKPPGPDQWWWEPSRVIHVGDTKNGRECGVERCGLVPGAEADQGWQADNHLPHGSGQNCGSMDDSALLRMEGERPEQQTTGVVQSSEGARTVGHTTAEYGSGQGQGQWQGKVGRAGSRETSGAGEIESSLGGSSHGSPDWVDYAQLSQSVDSRTDELRLLGNGVDPDVAENAFRVLYGRLCGVHAQ